MQGLEAKMGEKVYGDSKGLKDLVHGVLNLPNIKQWWMVKVKSNMETNGVVLRSVHINVTALVIEDFECKSITIIFLFYR